MKTNNGVPATRRWRIWHVAGLLLLLAVAGLVGYGLWPSDAKDVEGSRRSYAEEPPSVATVTAVVVQPIDFPVTAEATGHLAPWRLAEVSAEAGGVVLERFVEEGAHVSAGAVLLRLDDREARIEFEETKAELLRARVDYAIRLSQAGVAVGDTIQLASARAAFEQAKLNYDAGQLSADALQEARRRLEATEILSGTQRAAVQAVLSGFRQAEQRFERARLALDRAEVRAPFAGRVADLRVNVGHHVTPGQVVLTLLDNHLMKVAVDVLEVDVVHLAPGRVAWIRVPALGDAVLQGTLHALNPRIDRATGTGRVTVALPNPQDRLLDGLFANVKLETRRLPRRLVVPADAVLMRQGRDFVFTVVDGKAQWVYVTTGIRSGDWIEVLEGLSPGDTVLVKGHFALAHDAPVEVVDVRPMHVE